ncbi:transcriptional repressor of cell division inhibition gene dicB [Gammaproteobacteria bacterium]
MNKKEAIEIHGSVSALASALKISREAIYQWPDELPHRIRLQVIGAALEKNHNAVATAPHHPPGDASCSS